MSIDEFISPNGKCQGIVKTDKNGNIVINGICREARGATKVRYAAAAPADHRASYMGSGLPFPNAEVAYQGSPNTGEVPLSRGVFTIKITSPNSYYKFNGSKVIEPHIQFTINDDFYDVPLPSSRKFKNRSLTSIEGRPIRVTRR